MSMSSSTQHIPEWRAHGKLAKFIQAERAQTLEQSLYEHLRQLYQNYDQMFDASPCFQHIYSARINDLCRLLDEQSKTYQKWLRDRINDNQTDLSTIVKLRPWEVRPDHWKDLIAEYQRQISSLGQMAQATCNLFLCKKCGKKETTYFEMQSRSCDEPMTIYITCVNCGHQWKQ
jgi:DNA-directed RNA polymerase subunit M/transcription elongation factor TFIIS